MQTRRNVSGSMRLSAQVRLTTGPGALSQALGLHRDFTGQSLVSPDAPVWIEASDNNNFSDEIAAGPRIGVDYAGECAAWPWRFWLKNSPFVKKLPTRLNART